MNFILHERDLKELLSVNLGSREGWKGCYFISQDEISDSFKVGVSWGQRGIFNRLKDYKICWPFTRQFFLHYVVISATADEAKRVERAFLDEKKRFIDIDRNPNNQGRVSREYKLVTKKNVLKKVIYDVLNKRVNINDWMAVIVFGENSWRIFINNGKNSFNWNNMSKPRRSRSTKNFLFY